MTSIGLMDQLEEKIHQIINEFRLQANHGEQKIKPAVHVQYLSPKKPKKQEEMEPDFPHVIIRYLGEMVAGGFNRVSVSLIAGVYNQDHQVAFRDILNVLTRIKNELMRQPIIGAFELNFEDIEIEVPEEQYFPEWVGVMSLKFNTPTVQAEGGIGIEY
jgi:hypothetical protein